MHPFFQSKFIRIGGIVIVLVVAFFVFVVLASLNDARSGISSDSLSYAPMGLSEGCYLKRDISVDRAITYNDVRLPEGRLSDRCPARRAIDGLFLL